MVNTKIKRDNSRKFVNNLSFFYFENITLPTPLSRTYTQVYASLLLYLDLWTEIFFYFALLLFILFFVAFKTPFSRFFFFFFYIMRTKCYILEMKANYVGTTIHNPKVNHYNHSVMILRPMGWNLWLQLCITVQFHEFKCLE